MAKNTPEKFELLPEKWTDRPFSFFPSWPGNWPRFFEENFMPFAEDFSMRGARIYEENNQLHVELPLPGLNSDDIEVSLNKGVLIVKGESKQDEEDKNRKFYRSSRRNYSYSFALPSQIDEKQEPQADYTDGILKITLKLANKSAAKKIPVKSGKSKNKKLE